MKGIDSWVSWLLCDRDENEIKGYSRSNSKSPPTRNPSCSVWKHCRITNVMTDNQPFSCTGCMEYRHWNNRIINGWIQSIKLDYFVKYCMIRTYKRILNNLIKNKWFLHVFTNSSSMTSVCFFALEHACMCVHVLYMTWNDIVDIHCCAAMSSCNICRQAEVSGLHARLNMKMCFKSWLLSYVTWILFLPKSIWQLQPFFLSYTHKKLCSDNPR